MKLRTNRRKPWTAKYCRMLSKNEPKEDSYYVDSGWRRRVIRGWKPCPLIADKTEHPSCKYGCISAGHQFILGTSYKRLVCPNKINPKTGEWGWSVWRPIRIAVLQPTQQPPSVGVAASPNSYTGVYTTITTKMPIE